MEQSKSGQSHREACGRQGADEKGYCPMQGHGVHVDGSSEESPERQRSGLGEGGDVVGEEMAVLLGEPEERTGVGERQDRRARDQGPFRVESKPRLQNGRGLPFRGRASTGNVHNAGLAARRFALPTPRP